MTDMPEAHTVRSFAASRPRSILVIALEAAQRANMAAIACLNRSAREDPRTQAERARLAESLREEARRRVDRLMM